ncbi:hypothetical protein [Ruminococcus sp.]|uniref:hypothetical protein n=1 Tax=Ruminococcus sp. TaxID=41978 RepID=UPI001B4C169E|nr:hypothetical protein [Ruminococcus sp.]MBP5431046.1 hypothetical protein [Ruminococcus sp.]
MTKNRFRLDPLNARFRIRNGITGGYIHITLFRILEFPTRQSALAYMKRAGLNKEIYYTEAVR